MPDRPMLAAEFVERMRAEMDEFLEYWTERHENNPEQFPAKMPEGEWFEQYTAWSTLEAGRCEDSGS
jgi:hypothetical protein